MNKRALKTKREILQAVHILVHEKSFDDITVVDIIEKAEISRGTFYLHYEDKYFMLQQYEEQFFDVINAHKAGIFVETDDIVQMIISRKKAVIDILVALKEHQLLLEVLLHSSVQQSIQQRMELLARDIFHHTFNSIPGFTQVKVPVELVTKIAASLFLTVINHWIDDKMMSSPQELTQFISSMLIRGPIQTMGISIDENLLEQITFFEVERYF